MSVISNEHMLKMSFEFETDDGSEIESMWVKLVDKSQYEISNVPFYVMGIALGDVVLGENAQDGSLRFIKVARSGGHSTIRVLVFSESKVREVCAVFEDLGCQIEISDIKTLLAVDIPPSTEWSKVRITLERLAAEGAVDWEEAALSRHHVP